MLRTLTRCTLAFVAAFALACADSPSAPPAATPEDATTLVNAQSDIRWSAGCPASGQLSTLALLLIARNNDERRVVLARLAELSEVVRSRRQERIQQRAHALVAWLLQRYRDGKFRGTDAQFAALVNAIYCFAGINISIDSPKNTVVVLPTDEAQVVTTQTGLAGVNLPANVVTEPTLLTIEEVPDTFPTNGFLSTKLDQYPGFLRITTTSAGGSGLAQPVVVAVCPQGAIPAAVRARLRLGHDASSGFRIEPPADASFLNCPQVIGQAAAPLWQRLASSLLPRELHAFQDAFGGGVGGTATEFSPFAPVDPVLEFGGGVGGTATEFTRSSFSSDPFTVAPAALLSDCSVGAVSSPVVLECIPYVTVRTRLGTVLSGAPVTWEVLAGNGVLAPRAGGSCGTFGATATGFTSFTGRSEICWTLGPIEGDNRVRGTPAAGGDVPAGVVFEPAHREFTIHARFPKALTAISGEAQTGAAGALLGEPLVLRATDEAGLPVPGLPITWTVYFPRGAIGSIQVLDAVTDGNGYARALWTLGGPGYNEVLAEALGSRRWLTFTATATAP